MDKLNFFAFFLPIVLFIFWSLIGYSTLSLFNTQRHTISNLLLSPTVGLGVILLPIFCINRIGIPIGQFGGILSIIVGIISISILLWKKPLFPIKKYLPYFGIFLLALFLTGRPLIDFGFNWISYVNDDMANYCLGATRFLKKGYTELPTDKEFIANNFTLFSWYLYNVLKARAGSELLLAWISSVLQLNPLQLFMPLILALHLTLVSTTGALIYFNSKWRKASLWVCFLMACSSLTTLGTLYQLIGQIGGLSLLIGFYYFLFLPLRRNYIRRSILLMILGTSLAIYYPEIFALLICSILLFTISFIFKIKNINFIYIKSIIFALFISLIVINNYVINLLYFFLAQIEHGASVKHSDLFPYFLIPSGFANLWGLFPIAFFPIEPKLTIYILIGIILSIVLLIFSLIQLRNRNYISYITLSSLFLILAFFITKNGFALFKMAMYIQPFLVCTYVIGLYTLTIREVPKLFLLIPLAIVGIQTQNFYVVSSKGGVGKPFVELANASEAKMLEQLKQISHKLSANELIYVDTPHTITAKIMGSFFSSNAIYISKPHFFNDFVAYCQNMTKQRSLFARILPYTYNNELSLVNKMKNPYDTFSFNLHDNVNPKLINTFMAPDFNVHPDTNILLSTSNVEILNKRKFDESVSLAFTLKRAKDISNHLIFINSNFGQEHNFTSDHVSLNNLEQDLFYPKGTFAAIGRYLLFQIINPGERIRAELDFTNTLASDGKNLLPPIHFIGDKNQLLPIIGRGSARIFSSPFTAQIINNNPYVMLDMGTNGYNYANHPTGLMKLYGKTIQLDRRQLVGFLRDISIVSENEYQNMVSPSILIKFPDDLRNKNLEYSGIYEDGWISEDSFFSLTQNKTHHSLIIKGLLPSFKENQKPTILEIFVDGKKIASKQISPGFFDFKLNTPILLGSKRRINLHFNQFFALPSDDMRPVAAKIERLGFA